MDELDTDRDGYVDLGEFAAFHDHDRGERELRDSFDVDDINGDGRISEPRSARSKQRICRFLGIGATLSPSVLRSLVTDCEGDVYPVEPYESLSMNQVLDAHWGVLDDEDSPVGMEVQLDLLGTVYNQARSVASRPGRLTAGWTVG
ncbi:hypothetical protein ZWY2020_056021 [Hordeum vulgare]|nr:hypothetical protein ZWY2020_056021 [Hordeum vulgare]